jgi:uncharacterized protein YaaR (DUF327 family)
VKINPGWRPFGKIIQPADNSTPAPLPSKNFSDTLHHQDEKANLEQLNRMLKQIQVQGERLAKSMTVRELRLYKQMVKQFLEETVRRGISIKDTKGWDRRGRGKRYKLLDEIDRYLLDMADSMLETEQGKIDLLVKMGEVRGLLINLFF